MPKTFRIYKEIERLLPFRSGWEAIRQGILSTKSWLNISWLKKKPVIIWRGKGLKGGCFKRRQRDCKCKLKSETGSSRVSWECKSRPQLLFSAHLEVIWDSSTKALAPHNCWNRNEGKVGRLLKNFQSCYKSAIQIWHLLQQTFSILASMQI